VPFRVYDLQIDDGNEGEFGRHGVSEREVRQVLDNAPIFLPNRRGHAARMLMIGPTFGGRFLTVPLAPTHDETLWRPATAWDSDAEELVKYQRATPRR
jgi:hypothetical protein